MLKERKWGNDILKTRVGVTRKCQRMLDLNRLYWGPWIPRWLGGKESSGQCRSDQRLRFDPWVEKILWRRKWQPTRVFLPGKSHGRRRRRATVRGVAKSHSWACTHAWGPSVIRKKWGGKRSATHVNTAVNFPWLNPTPHELIAGEWKDTNSLVNSWESNCHLKYSLHEER